MGPRLRKLALTAHVVSSVGWLGAVAGFLALANASPVLHSGGALIVLLAAATLAIYKPRGVTRYGRRKQRDQRAPSQP